MKKNFIVIAALLLTITGHSQIKKFGDIIGTWKIAGEQNSGASLQFIDSSTIVLTYMGEKKKIIDYKFDFSKSPVWFDFSTKDSMSTHQVKSLMIMFGDDMIKWQLFADEDRPDHFSSSQGELIYLKKSKATTPNVVLRD